MSQDGTWIVHPEITPEEVADMVAMYLDGDHSELLNASMYVSRTGAVVELNLIRCRDQRVKFRITVEEAP